MDGKRATAGKKRGTDGGPGESGARRGRFQLPRWLLTTLCWVFGTGFVFDAVQLVVYFAYHRQPALIDPSIELPNQLRMTVAGMVGNFLLFVLFRSQMKRAR